MPGTEMGWSSSLSAKAMRSLRLKAVGGKAGPPRVPAPAIAVDRPGRGHHRRWRQGSAAGCGLRGGTPAGRGKPSPPARSRAKRHLRPWVDMAHPRPAHLLPDARLAIVQGWEVWFVQAQPIRKKLRA